MKSGQNNNGYVPYVDYTRDYSPPPSQLQRNYNTLGSTGGGGVIGVGSNSYSTHLNLTTANNTPTSQSSQQLNGQLPGGNLSLTRNRQELRQENGLPSIQSSMNSLPNVLLGKSTITKPFFFTLLSSQRLMHVPCLCLTTTTLLLLSLLKATIIIIK